jgi:sirohydrochlorin cobaltochelatase
VKGIILLAHGSRDPLWGGPVQSVAERLRTANAAVPVCCAYLELQPPDLLAAVQQMADKHVTELAIVPMFLGTGKHVRDDLPHMVEALRARYPSVRMSLRQPVGEDPRVLDVLAAVAGE